MTYKKNSLLAPALSVALSLLLGACAQGPRTVNEAELRAWVAGFEQDARAEGISPDLLKQAFGDFYSSQRILELDRKQPESTQTFEEYRAKLLSPSRIARGQELMRIHAAELKAASERYGVPVPYIVALWGMETDYGRKTGNTDIVEALGTLAFDGRRSEFFRKELLTALHIAQDDHIPLPRMKGSWAGAMGQTQFMPSSYKRFAVDADGDGRPDIWESLPDIFASIANYLHSEGWQEDLPWGWEADAAPAGGGERMVPNKNGEGEAFVVTSNYRVLKKWNRSDYFATTVGLLADALAGDAHE